MDVAVTELRANLKAWLDRARQGEELVVTDRGLPVARIIGVDSTPLIERLVQYGVIGKARAPKTSLEGLPRVTARRSVSDRVSEHRR